MKKHGTHITFVADMSGVLPQRDPSPPGPSRPARHNRHSNDPRYRPSHWQFACGLCQDDHPLRNCHRFRQQTPYQRYETVERRSYCRNCLARSHLAPDCPVLTACRECNLRHHTMLHGAPQLRETFGRYTPPPVELPYHRSSVFIPTAQVYMAGENSEDWASVRVLLCQAATSTRVAASTITRLGIPTTERNGHRFASIRLRCRTYGSRLVYRLKALVTRDLPRRPYSDPIIEDPTVAMEARPLADIDPRGNESIDVEIGAGPYAYLRRDGVVETGLGRVFAQLTDWGYVFVGPVSSSSQETR
ncbi:uncharacterized protein LOC142240317 isoform X2 [Haematobia irritans]|uniref:uncharacterized protein LOC142219419 n=2 Tax=Haematobia irritans TaxID=7368 RepID=UPI003F4FB33F